MGILVSMSEQDKPATTSQASQSQSFLVTRTELQQLYDDAEEMRDLLDDIMYITNGDTKTYSDLGPIKDRLNKFRSKYYLA